MGRLFLCQESESPAVSLHVPGGRCLSSEEGGEQWLAQGRAAGSQDSWVPSQLREGSGGRWLEWGEGSGSPGPAWAGWGIQGAWGMFQPVASGGPKSQPTRADKGASVRRGEVGLGTMATIT